MASSDLLAGCVGDPFEQIESTTPDQAVRHIASRGAGRENIDICTATQPPLASPASISADTIVFELSGFDRR